MTRVIDSFAQPSRSAIPTALLLPSIVVLARGSHPAQFACPGSRLLCTRLLVSSEGICTSGVRITTQSSDRRPTNNPRLAVAGRSRLPDVRLATNADPTTRQCIPSASNMPRTLFNSQRPPSWIFRPSPATASTCQRPSKSRKPD
jgi:hypothetical protein